MTWQVLIAPTIRRIVPSRKRQKRVVTGQPLFDSPVGGTTLPPFRVASEVSCSGEIESHREGKENHETRDELQRSSNVGAIPDPDPAVAARPVGERSATPSDDQEFVFRPDRCRNATRPFRAERDFAVVSAEVRTVLNSHSDVQGTKAARRAGYGNAATAPVYNFLASMKRCLAALEFSRRKVEP